MGRRARGVFMAVGQNEERRWLNFSRQFWRAFVSGKEFDESGFRVILGEQGPKTFCSLI